MKPASRADDEAKLAYALTVGMSFDDGLKMVREMFKVGDLDACELIARGIIAGEAGRERGMIHERYIKPASAGSGQKTRHATGTAAAWGWGLSRIMATFPESLFSELKIAALKNGRSISAEIRTRIEQSFIKERGTA